MDALIGQKLGKYRIDRLLAEGGMGAVYQAEDTTLARTVAIKVMHRQFSQQDDFRKRFLQEARTAARLNHPGIVKVHAFEQINGLLFIVMEYIPGEDLQLVLESMVRERQWLELPQAVKLIVQVGMALDYVHRQRVLHRDIKPANIMLKGTAENPGYFQPILTDLGLAKLAEVGTSTHANRAMGTPAYMSPEQASGHVTDARSDVYSLGVLLYELAVGKRPFPIRSLTDAVNYHVHQPVPPPRMVHPNLPPVLEQVILRMLAKNPAQRYESALAVAQHLSTIPTSVLSVPVPTAAVAGARSMVIMALSSLGTERPATPAVSLPPPVASAYPYLEIVSPNGSARTANLMRRTLTIGRDNKNDVVLLDDRVSRQHAKVEYDGVHCRITDLNSSNGSFLAQNRLPVGVAAIWPSGAVLQLGNHRVRFIPPAPAAPSPLHSQPAMPTYGATVSTSYTNGMTALPGATEPFRLPQSGYSAGPYAIQPQTAYAAGSVATAAQTTYAAGAMTMGAAATLAAGPDWMEPRRKRRLPALYLWLISLLALLLVAAGAWLILFRGGTPTSSLAALLSSFGLTPSVSLPSATPTLTATPAATKTPVPATTEPTAIAAAAVPLPDLVIEELAFTPRRGECDDGSGLELQVIVANLGAEVAGEFIVEVNGASRLVQAGLSPQLHEIVKFDEYSDSNTVTIDPDDSVQESREENNRATIDVAAGTVPTCKPTATPTPLPVPTATPTAVVKESSTGVMIAYVYGNAGATDIFVYDMENGESRAVAANPTCAEAEPRWFPGAGALGARLLYQSDCDGAYELYALTLATGKVERLTQTADYHELDANISPDGRSIVYRRAQQTSFEQERNNIGDIFQLDLASGEMTSLGVRGRAPMWSPNGAKLAYMSNEHGSWQIYRYDLASREIELVSTNCPMHCRWPAWLPDGRSLSYSVADEGMRPKGIWIAPFGNEPYEWLAGDVGRASWSETNQATFNSEDGIEIINFDGSNRTLIVSNGPDPDPNAPPYVAPFWNR